MTCNLLSERGANLPAIPHEAYPRPMLVRDSYISLNGLWDFGAGENECYDKRILVPFAPESILSGINEVYPENFSRYYKRSFTLPEGFNRGRVILHFGAVDQTAEVYINGTSVCKHTGGYFPFCVDITDHIRENNEIKVKADDHLSELVLPYGKQSIRRGGMWYTPTSGIWQPVWLESVPEEYIRSISTTVTKNKVTVRVNGIQNGTLTLCSGESYSLTNGICEITLNEPILWSPENPYLYRFTVTSGEDKVSSYFAVRTISVGEINGKKRLLLNGKPYFFHGLLDQGYWSDGQLLPADPSCYGEEILKMKALGFNTLRKHIKIEPQLFYYECDRLGMIVFQDMVNNGKYRFIRDTVLPTIGLQRKNDKRMHRKKAQRTAFLDALKQTVSLLDPHPSVCYWTVFNEGWGQFESDKAYKLMKSLDSSRIIDTTSGWFRCGASDVDSKHIYFRKIKIKPSDKPVVLSEFGGATLAVKDHLFNEENTYGYGKSETREDFVKSLRTLYLTEILPATKNGLCASIFTQLSDVEDEINGLITFDRKVQKILPDEFADIAELLQEGVEE